LRQRASHVDEALRPATEFREGCLDEQIRGYERAIEIHHERVPVGEMSLAASRAQALPIDFDLGAMADQISVVDGC
jgi:hypothetical protein